MSEQQPSWTEPLSCLFELNVCCVLHAGSACLFSALMRKCSERNVFALCRLVSRRNYSPRFVALVPQKEEVDEGKVQITPPGNTPLGSDGVPLGLITPKCSIL